MPETRETRGTLEGQQDARVTWQYSSQDALAGGDEGGGTHINQHIPVGQGLLDTLKQQWRILAYFTEFGQKFAKK